jgi:hypothetical protein
MIKEVASYEKEVIQNEGRIQKMKDEQKDQYGLFFYFVSVINVYSLHRLISYFRYTETRRSSARKLYDDS